MQMRTLGKNGPKVSALGLGCMGMSEYYGPRDDAESMATLNRSLDLGMTFLDTADAYGVGANERLVGELLQTRRKEVFLATKFGIMRSPEGGMPLGISGKPEYVRQCCEASLERLGVDVIDLYYQHRVDPQTPIEETVGTMARLVEEGKVRYLGLSEASEKSIRRAENVHHVTALQSEYSLWTRDPEDGILATCRELGIGFVAYSPLGRGFLTGEIKSPDDFAENDYRRIQPRFSGENFQKNLDLVAKIREIAAEKRCTPSQLAIAWLMAQGDDIVPIPGTKRRKYLEDNAGALGMTLTAEDLARIATVAPKGVAAGTRYPAMMMQWVNN